MKGEDSNGTSVDSKAPDKSLVSYSVRTDRSKIVGSNTYQMIYRNKKCEEKISKHKAKIPDCIRVQTQQLNIDSAMPISILTFRGTLKAACDSSRISDRAAVCLSLSSVKHLAA